jgi:ribonucleotide monophosphatase NagD (HAD superfamily)
LILDAGPYVAALEYAAGIEAEVVGKPSRAFFELCLQEIGLLARDVLVVGDDVENDAMGGARAGCRVALVRTGKFSEEMLARSDVRPDLLLDSVADLS